MASEVKIGTYTSQDGTQTAKVYIWPAYMSNGPTFGCHDADYEVPVEVEIEPKDSPLRAEIMESFEEGTLESDLQ